MGANLKALLSLLLLLSICSCKGGGGGSPSQAAAAPVDPRAALIEESHIGLWASCFNDTGNNSSYLDIKSFASDSMTSSYFYYSGLNCQSANLQFEDRYVYDVKRDGTKHTSSLRGASTRPKHSSDVTYNNTESWCGYSDWALNVPKNILNVDCDGTTMGEGDGGDFTLSRNGANIVMVTSDESTTLTPLIVPGFGHAGTAITNGDYVFYSDDVASMITFNSGSYTLQKVNAQSGVRYTQSGTYAVSGDDLTLTMASESPSCGVVGDAVTVKYTPNSIALILKDGEGNLATAEPFDWTSGQFTSAFVGASGSTGCL